MEKTSENIKWEYKIKILDQLVKINKEVESLIKLLDFIKIEEKNKVTQIQNSIYANVFVTQRKIEKLLEEFLNEN